MPSIVGSHPALVNLHVLHELVDLLLGVDQVHGHLVEPLAGKVAPGKFVEEVGVQVEVKIFSSIEVCLLRTAEAGQEALLERVVEVAVSGGQQVDRQRGNPGRQQLGQHREVVMSVLPRHNLAVQFIFTVESTRQKAGSLFIIIRTFGA